MSNDSAQEYHGPIRSLSIAWLITLCALVAFLWCAYDSYRRFARTAQQNLRIQELRGQIIHLDEVLTMSARMCALTGDISWESRYRQFEPHLDAAIHEAITYSLGIETTKQTEAANAALIQFENRAFELVREGKLDQAKAKLFSEAYATQQATYSQGMDKLGNQLAEGARSAMDTERRRITFQLAGGAMVIALLLVGWVVVLRIVNQGIRTRKQLDKVERDLDIARQIQRGLLPKDLPDMPGFEMEGWSKPADETGGDYYDWIQLPDGRVAVVIADVTGHGIGPALLMAVCRAYARASVPALDPLRSAVEHLNKLVSNDFGSGRFVTLAVAVVSPGRGEIELLSAGHGPTLVYRRANGGIESFDGDGLPLGILPDEQFVEPRRIAMSPGDALLLSTDGFMEAPGEDGSLFGVPRLSASLAAHAGRPIGEILGRIDEDVRVFSGAQRQTDDMTAVVIRRVAG